MAGPGPFPRFSSEVASSSRIHLVYTIDPALHPVLSVDTEWIGRLEQGGFSFRIADGWLRCYRTLYLDHLATRGGTLGEQVRVLAQWLNEAFQDLGRLGPDTPPAETRRGER